MPATSDDILQSLNQAQRRAVSSDASTVAILAGPGSGKTHTLTSRVVWLVDHVGYKPCDVVVATFTVKAAREMKERIGRALGDGREKSIILGTFHSIARRYLSAYGQRIGLNQKFGIADDSDSRGILARICKRLDVKIDPPIVRSWISKKKARGNGDDDAIPAKSGKSVESRALETCYEEYQKHLERSNLLDYDDLLVRCVELLRQYPSCVSNVNAVLIDEYQDTNGVQYELTKLLAQKRQRITIVGDPDQSIYGWRSAEIKNLRRFLRDFAGTEEVSLEENYRSSSSILDVSLKVIQQDDTRYKKALVPVHDKGTRPVLRRLRNPMKEADWIVSEIRRVTTMSGYMIDSSDIAILLRSAALSRHIESALGKAGVAYKMVGGFKFYDRAEIKTLLDYLRMIHQPHNNDALARIINVPKRGVGEATIKGLLDEAERNSMSLWTLLEKHCRGDRTAQTTIRKQTEQKISGEFIRLIKRLRSRLYEGSGDTPPNLVELIEQLLQDLRFEKHLKDIHGPEHEGRWANIQEFVSLAGEFMKDQTLADEDVLPEVEGLQQMQETDTLARFLANVSLASDKQTHDSDEAKSVTVSTIHAAKGLEWPIVFIPAVYKGSIPHMRSDDEAEERRLLYVAMTRAKAFLYLSAPLYSSHTDSGSLELSPFIASLSNHFLKQGPSFQRPTMMEVARILRRQLSSEADIYERVPDMTAVEDNLYPVDPNDTEHDNSAKRNYSNEGGLLKRQKTNHTRAAPPTSDTVEGWNAPFPTTMERASSFTLPGFTTAGAQHAMVAAEAATARAAPRPAPPGARRPMQNRPPAQRSLLSCGVVKSHDQSNPIQEPELPITRLNSNGTQHSLQNVRKPWSRHRSEPTPRTTPQASAAIQPELLTHKLGKSNLSTKPKPLQVESRESGAEKACADFSTLPTGQSPGKEGEKEEEEAIPPDEKVQPASCFHATTVKMPPTVRTFKKPAPLVRDGVAPIDRVRRPFKPLSINRSK